MRYESSLFEDLRSCKNDLKLKLDKIELTKLTFCQNDKKNVLNCIFESYI